MQDLYYLPTLHQFQYEVEDGYRRDGSPVRIGYNEEVFPEYSWRGYGSFSKLQDEVLLDTPVTSPSVYRVILRYTNPNSESKLGEVSLVANGEGRVAEPQTHHVLLPPTGGQPAFVTVSGDKGIYASPFDLAPGQWTTSIKIKNDGPDDQDVLVVTIRSNYCISFIPNLSLYVTVYINVRDASASKVKAKARNEQGKVISA